MGGPERGWERGRGAPEAAAAAAAALGPARLALLIFSSAPAVMRCVKNLFSSLFIKTASQSRAAAPGCSAGDGACALSFLMVNP